MRKSSGGYFFLKIDQSNEFAIFKETFKIFAEISQTIVFFGKTRENLTQGFEMILKIGQNNAFLLFSNEIFEGFLKNSQTIVFFV